MRDSHPILTTATAVERETTYPHADDFGALHASRGRAGQVEQFMGIVQPGPSASGAAGDYADARYYVARAVPKAGAEAAAVVSAVVDSLPGVGETITATNLAELADGTHFLAPQLVVQVFAFPARGAGSKVFVFNQPVAPAVIVKITASAAAGEYNGRIVAGRSNATAAADFTMPAGMTVSAADDALILNLEEQSLPGNRLANGTFAVGVVRGRTGDSPPRTIVVVRGGVGRTDSAATLGSTSAGTETADAATWAKDTDARPVNVFVTTRVVYNPSGDKTLYSFVRQFAFDARGLLISISGETRVTVDVTEACS